MEEQKYTLIGIDQSLISTSVCIDGVKLFNYCREDDACTKKGGLSKWYKMCEHLIKYRFIKYEKFDNYSDGEISKIRDYDIITDMIVEDIIENTDTEKPIRVAIEGYSYSSTNTTSLIDLIAFSTLLRQKIYNNVTTHITVVAPTSLKKYTGTLTYEGVKKGKKMEYRNGYGVAAGSFSKFDMALALIECKQEADNNYVDYLREIKDELFAGQSIKKPMEDQTDSYLLYAIMKHGLI